MQDVLLLEPDANQKKRCLSGNLLARPTSAQPTPSDVKKRLKEIREYSLSNQDLLLDQLICAVGGQAEVYRAADAVQAAENIKAIGRGLPIAANKSSVVSSELRPHLLSRGLTVIDSYHEEFKPFDNRFQASRMCPQLVFEPIWNSFGRPKSLSLLRREHLEKSGCKDFIGLLGVNAVSAADGTVVLLQHMHNIKKIFTQARTVILVIALDKIVRDVAAAVYQAKCMAVFGADSLPMTLNGADPDKNGIQEMTFGQPGPPAHKLHLILLDNGRTRIRHSLNQDLLLCIGCRACLKVCPAAAFFNADMLLSPREYLYAFASNSGATVDRCIQCKSCRAACPLEIDIPGMIIAAGIAAAGKRSPLSDYLLARADLLENIGSAAPAVAGMIYDNRMLRWLGEKVVGVSRRRKIPPMRRIDLAKWYHDSEKTDEAGHVGKQQ